MKYIVMECHLSYAVLLDEEGHFLKAANRGYQVGQTVYDPVLVGSYRYRPPMWRILFRLLLLLLVCAALFLGVRACTDEEDWLSFWDTEPVVTTAEGSITAQRAKEIVLDYSGMDPAQISAWSVELGEEDGIVFYDVDFIIGNIEHEFKVNAATGEVFEYEIDDN